MRGGGRNSCRLSFRKRYFVLSRTTNTQSSGDRQQGDKADLENIMKEHGFSEVCTRLIVHEIAGTSAGRPFKYSLRRVQVQMVAEARSGLRAKGTRGKVLQRALDEAEARYKVWAKNMRANVPGLRPPAFDRKYIRNYLKRPKRRP